VRYYVYAPNGQRFGPADLPTLQMWIHEGRVLPSSMLEDEMTLARMPASSVAGLTFPATTVTATPPPPNTGPTPFEANPYAAPSNYYRAMPGDYDGAKDVTNAWICLVAAILCFPLISIGGIVLASRAKKLGNPSATAPYIANIVYTCLWAAGCVFYGLFVMLAIGSGGFH